MDENTTRFRELLEQGEAAAKKSEFERADELLARAEAISQNSTRLLKARGAVLLAQMKPAFAIRYFDRALGLDSNDPAVLSGRGMCDVVQKRYASAGVFFERALRIKPDYVVALHQLLECSYNIDQFNMALECLRKFLDLHPSDINIRFCLAGCLFKTDAKAAALEELRVIQEIAPDFDGANELRKVIEASMQNSETPNAEDSDSLSDYSSSSMQDSLKELSKSVATWTVRDATSTTKLETPLERRDSETISNILSEIEEQKRSKDFEQAEAQLDELLSGNIQSKALLHTARCLKAELLVIRGELAAANTLYDKVLLEDPKVSRALCGKGALAAEAQSWVIAKNYFEQAVALNTNSDIGYAGLGLCAMVEGKEELSFELFETATRKNPENQRALLGVLQTGYPLKKYNEMERMLSSYLGLYPESIDMLYSLAGVLFAQGKVKEAQLEVEKILVVDPKHEHALELREMIELGSSSSRENLSN